jgi:hypothetical protein
VRSSEKVSSGRRLGVKKAPIWSAREQISNC